MDWQHNNIMRIAEVLEVHPESHSISVRFLDDGTRVPDVMVMSASPSTRTGVADYPAPEVPEDEERDITDTEKVYSLAVIAMTSSIPVCLGFVYPQVNEMAFEDIPNLRVWRHPSDVYSVVQDNADMELRHPGGAMIKMGSGQPFELEGKDYDKKWKIRRNLTPTQLTIANGVGGSSATAHTASDSKAPAQIDLQPNADINITSERWVVSSGAQMNRVESANVVHIRAGVEIVLDAPVVRVAGALVLGPPGKWRGKVPDDPACLRNEPSPESVWPPECLIGDPATRPAYCPPESLKFNVGG